MESFRNLKFDAIHFIFVSWKGYLSPDRRNSLRSRPFFPFAGGETEQASEQAGERRNAPGVSKGWKEVGEAPYFSRSIAVSFPSRAFLEAPATQVAVAISRIT